MVQVGTGSTGVQLVYYPGTVLQCRSTVEATRVHVCMYVEGALRITI